jgi:hypothetical protein
VDGSYSIGYTLGAGGVDPDIQWPQVLTSDDALVAFINDLRKYGVSVLTQIDNTQGQMVMITNKVKAIYQRGFYQEPVQFKFFITGEGSTLPPNIDMLHPKSVWVFQRVVMVHPPSIAYMEYPGKAPKKGYADLSEELSQHIPDIHKWITLPCSCGKKKKGSEAQIWYAIQHLNDDHHPDRRVNGRRRKDIWTRERIADWLDEIDADLVFDPDLPAKQAAEREARRKAVIDQNKASLAATLADAKVDVAAMVDAVKKTSLSMVQLKVAIKEFEAALGKSFSTPDFVVSDETFAVIDATLKGPLPGCKCTICTTVKQDNQEES